MYLSRILPPMLAITLIAAPAFSQGPFDRNNFSYPRKNPRIAWSYEPTEKIEYEVCNDSGEPMVFYWDKAKFGAAHNCLLRSGSCVVKPDLLSASSGQSTDASVINTGVFDSKFDLNGSDFGDDVPTRLWCDKKGEVECDAIDEDWTITSILGLSASENYCNFEESPFSQDAATEELRISASAESDRWQINLGSSLDASLVVFFVNIDGSDLVVEDADFQEVPLEPIEADFSNFGETPPDIASANLLGFTAWSEDAPYEGSFYLTRKTDNALRPMLLATSGGQVFAIMGLGAPIR